MSNWSHLAIVTPLPPATSGIAQYGYRVSREIARAGVFERVTLLTDHIGQGSADDGGNLTTERIWHRGRLDVGWRIAARLQKLQPDVTWFNLGTSAFGGTAMSNLSGLLSPWVARGAGRATVVTMHELLDCADLRALRAPRGLLVPMGARLIWQFLSRADAVCVTLRRHAATLEWRYPRARIVHIPHGAFDEPEMLPSPDSLELLSFCHAAPFKGLELLLTAFQQVQRRHPEARLTMAGAEHPRFPGYLSRLRHAFGDQPWISWEGYVPERDLRLLFARATAVVLPYAASTGSSGVLYRAAGWGRPIMASDLPELRAAAEEESLQVDHFRAGDLQSLVDVLDRLLADETRRIAQARHNLDIISQRLTLSNTAQAYLRTFGHAFRSRANVQPRPLPMTLTQ